MPAAGGAGETRPPVVLRDHGVVASLSPDWTWQRSQPGDAHQLVIYPPGRTDVFGLSLFAERSIEPGHAATLGRVLWGPPAR